MKIVKDIAEWTESPGASMTRGAMKMVLQHHGLASDSPTVFDGEGASAVGRASSSFDAELGIHNTYKRSDVYDWLGY